MLKLMIVTATTNLDRAQTCLQSWGEREKIIVENGATVPHVVKDSVLLGCRDYLGTVPAFRRGVDFALSHTTADLIACLHDDVEILDPSWPRAVLRCFERHPACGLAGFGGAIGLGSDQIYQEPYDPMQLARIGFRSNLVDAEVHGIRSLLSERVAALDGFSLIGRREFFDGLRQTHERADRPWTLMEDSGLVHHAYDSFLSALAARYGWETWYIPVRARHLGGQTAVGDQGYQSWAKDQISGGDQGFWEHAHKVTYETFMSTGVLPLRV